MENNMNKDYNRLHSGWSPNSAYNFGYSVTDVNTGAHNRQHMAIMLSLDITLDPLSRPEATLESTVNQKRPLQKTTSRWSFLHKKRSCLLPHLMWENRFLPPIVISWFQTHLFSRSSARQTMSRANSSTSLTRPSWEAGPRICLQSHFLHPKHIIFSHTWAVVFKVAGMLQVWGLRHLRFKTPGVWFSVGCNNFYFYAFISVTSPTFPQIQYVKPCTVRPFKCHILAKPYSYIVFFFNSCMWQLIIKLQDAFFFYWDTNITFCIWVLNMFRPPSNSCAFYSDDFSKQCLNISRFAISNLKSLNREFWWEWEGVETVCGF